jgi:hypothetical protein
MFPQITFDQQVRVADEILAFTSQISKKEVEFARVPALLTEQ